MTRPEKCKVFIECIFGRKVEYVFGSALLWECKRAFLASACLGLGCEGEVLAVDDMLWEMCLQSYL